MNIGVDVGYSNLKIGIDEDGSAIREIIMPIGAAPVSQVSSSLIGENPEYLQVVVDGEPWVVGVEPASLQSWSRELHEDYIASKAYKALFYAALIQSGTNKIETLVTGLPVKHCKDERKKADLISRLQGTHQVTPRRKITVESVRVVPQPAGAFADALHQTSDPALLEVMSEGRTLIVDAGFFSLDWLLLDSGSIHGQACDSSLRAMSMLLTAADEIIRAEYGAGPGVARLERAIREGKPYIFIHGEKVELDEFLKKASASVATSSMVALRESLRDSVGGVDVVVMAGGGAAFYEDAVRDVLGKSKFVTLNSPVLANARGFCRLGRKQ